MAGMPPASQPADDHEAPLRSSAAHKAAVNRALLHPACKPLLFVTLLLPLVWLVWGAATGGLGANPAETLIRSTGDWTLRGLCLTLAVTPVRQWTGWTALLRLRRMLGVFTFSYALLHFLCYAWLDMGLVPGDIVRDIIKRPFILVGSSALLLMLPLAATSFDRAVRALGGARWRRLHRVVYAVAVLAVVHFFWMRSGKNDYAEVAVYAGLLATLLGTRIWRHLRSSQRAARPPG
jgi:sulfoxide reductase heme-binding subunit YedZ